MGCYPHVLIVSSPDLNHLVHFLELGNRISSLLEDVRVTILAVTSSYLTETETIQAARARGTCEINEIHSDNIEPDASAETIMGAMKSRVRDVMKSMKLKQTVMIVGFFGIELLMSISDVGVTARYLYFPSHDLYRETMKSGLEIPTGDGILVNIWEELQVNILGSLRSDSHLNRVVKKVPVYPIGPITKPNELFIRTENPNAYSIFKWLNKKGERSVVFVCLESCEMSSEQMIEIAWGGLELSGRCFLWVRSNDDDDQVNDNCLPNGFLHPTRGIGLVVRRFQRALQAEFLSHRSIGGFLSDCSGNIVLESLTKGVPIIASPYYPSQKVNAMFLTLELGVAIPTSDLPSSENVIGREEVASLVKKIMEDEEIRAKAEVVKVMSEQAWTPGGSSRTSLLKWAKQCRLINKKKKTMSSCVVTCK